jgi:hypothetical protein
MGNSHLRSGGRYPVLRSIGILYLLFSALFALGGVVSGIYLLFRGPGNLTDRFVEMCATLAAAAFAVLTSLAIAELLKLFIDVEHNTRMAWMAVNGSAAAAGTTTTTTETVVAATSDGGRTATAHVNRIAAISASTVDEETAEGALLRGH